MLKNTKVKLTKKWWKDNKAVTLVDKGHLEKSLEFHERLIKLVKGSDQNAELIKSHRRVVENCDAMDRAATINSQACIKKIHDETKFVLRGSFLASVNAIRVPLQRRLTAHENKISTMSVADLFDSQNRPVLLLLGEYTKKSFSFENLEFLLVCRRGNYKNVDVYTQPTPKPESFGVIYV